MVRDLAGKGWGALGVSCYIDVDGSRFPRHADYESALDAVLRRGVERATSVGLSAASVESDLRRIRDHVRGGFDRSTTRSVAMFSCASADSWDVLHLPFAVRPHAHIGTSPAVAPLEAVLDAHERFAVLLIDRQHIRLIRVAMGTAVELASETAAARSGDHDPGRSGRTRDSGQAYDDAALKSHLRRAAALAFDVSRNDEFDRLLIGGTDALVAEVERDLHPYLRERFAGRLTLAADASIEDVRRAVLSTEVAVERDRQATDVERLRTLVARHDGAVVGLAGILGALQARRVATLLVSDGYLAEGWRCRSCSTLAAVGRRCPTCAESMEAVADVVEIAIEDALLQKCRVSVCAANADLDVLGRIGALLRY